MELLIIIIAGISGSVGVLLGQRLFPRHSVRECEKSYLYGHVDGYAKAVRDEL